MKLGILAYNTQFTYNGTVLKKGSMIGPCDPSTRKAIYPRTGSKFVTGIRCAPLMGGQFQLAEELQVWIPEDAEVMTRD